MSCTVEESGSVTVPCALMLEVLSVKSDDNVYCTLEDDILSLECGKSKYSFNCIPSEDFPPFPQMSGGKSFDIPAAAMELSIRRTLFATNPDDPRAFMGGLFIGVETGSLIMVATDGHRLTYSRIPDQSAPLDAKGVIVPARTMNELLRIFPSAKPEKADKDEKQKEAKVTVTVQDDAISFSLDGIYMISRLIKVDYPNYEKVIPGTNKGSCRVSKTRLISAVRGAAIMARAKENQNIIEFRVDGDVLRLSASTQDIGSAAEEVDIEHKGANIGVSFNSKYILEFLNVVEADEAVFEFSEELKATLFHVDSPDYKYVLMPIKI
jgi:DNA polymerase-3 subunit beta